jgi:Ca-activated chloride channel family protein
MVYYFQLILKLNLKRREKIFSNRNYAALANFSSRNNTAIKITLYLAAAALVIFAAARPQGLEKPEEIEANSIDICFAVDVSESMKATDLGRDNRLDITKAVVSHLIDNLKSDRVALVAFAGDASCICPLTLDHAAAKSLLMQADFDLMDKGGTRLDLAVKTAAERFNKDDEAAKVIVLFTDGEDHDGRPMEAASEAYKNGIIIHSVGIGSKSGVKIPVSYDVWGAPVYKKFNGKDVVTKLNEEVLKDISAAAGGDYFHVSDQNSLTKMISGLKSIKKRALRITSLNVAEELFAYFAFAALLLFLIDSLIPARNLRGMRGAFLLTAFVLLFAAGGIGRAAAEIAAPSVKSDYDSLSPKISQYSSKGADLYEKNKFGAAESEFQSSKILKPFDIVSNYNIGCARYKNRDYKGAIEAFSAAAKADAQNERFEPFYNMGNAHFKLFDYKNAIASYEQALKINPDDEDTKHNLEAARKKLEEELKKNQREEKDDKNSESSDKNDGGDKDSKEKQDQDSQQADKNGQKNDQGADKSKQTDPNAQNQSGADRDEKSSEAQQKPGAENGKPEDGKDGSGQGEKAVENLADRQNIEKYKNIQIDPDRLKMFLKDLENDEARVQQLYQRNKKRTKAAADDEMDIFEMDPQRLHERMRRQMLGEEDPRPDPKKNKAPANKKDW